MDEYWGEILVAGTLWGADVAQLRTLAQQFSKTADLLQQQIDGQHAHGAADEHLGQANYGVTS